MPKRTTTRRRVSRKKTVYVTRRKHRKGWWASLRAYLPGWAFWVGSFLVAGFCWWLWRLFLSTPDDSVVVYPDGYTVYGIDVSRYQTDINWELVRNQGKINGYPVSFAFVKATEGGDLVDPKFAYNFQQAAKYGIRRGAYHYFQPQTSAKAQAEFFIKHVELREGDLPPVLDVEKKPADMTAEAFKWGILEWLSLVEKHYGVKPILYTYYSFKMQYLNDVIFDSYPYWIAHYGVNEVAYKGSWTFWQFTEKGEVSGIKGPVDLNVFHGSLDELKEMPNILTN